LIEIQRIGSKSGIGGSEMDVKRRLPHEGLKSNEDGLPDAARVDDTEGHTVVGPDGLTVSPGTGGDFAPHKPSTGGEFIDENDVEGHASLTMSPGTGGDFMPHKPSTGGEFIDENEADAR
jgi:hypothetical protein